MPKRTARERIAALLDKLSADRWLAARGDDAPRQGPLPPAPDPSEIV